MTRQSFNNYIANLTYHQAALGVETSRQIRLGICGKCEVMNDLVIADVAINVISWYDIQPNFQTQRVYSCTGIRADAGGIQYFMVQNTEPQVNMFNVSDVVKINDGAGTIVDATIMSKSLSGSAYLFELSIGLTPGITYTMTKTTIETGDTVNFLTRNQMKSITSMLNKIHSTNYCVDYELTQP